MEKLALPRVSLHQSRARLGVRIQDGPAAPARRDQMAPVRGCRKRKRSRSLRTVPHNGHVEIIFRDPASAANFPLWQTTAELREHGSRHLLQHQNVGLDEENASENSVHASGRGVGVFSKAVHVQGHQAKRVRFGLRPGGGGIARHFLTFSGRQGAPTLPFQVLSPLGAHSARDRVQRHTPCIPPDVLEHLLNRFVGEPPPATVPRRHALYAVRVHPAISRRVALQHSPMPLVPVNQSRTVLLAPQAIGPGNARSLDVKSKIRLAQHVDHVDAQPPRERI